MKYACSKCGLAVIVVKDKVIAACKCKAAITASMTATAKGHGRIHKN